MGADQLHSSSASVCPPPSGLLLFAVSEITREYSGKTPSESWESGAEWRMKCIKKETKRHKRLAPL